MDKITLNTLNSKRTLILHRHLIRQNCFLKRLYQDFYFEIKHLTKSKKPIIELGSGGGFIKEVIPGVTTSDVIRGPSIDKVFSAAKMPFKRNSIGAFVLLNVFHHIKNPECALSEMEKCLKIGGKIIMIEPYNSLWGRFIYQHFHHEKFDPYANWKISEKGRLSGANGALPWIIFIRDNSKFSQKFPTLTIRDINIHTPLRYLISGGLSHPSLLPKSFYPLLKILELALSPFNSYLGMFATIEVQKRA